MVNAPLPSKPSALITGASSGLGALFARKFASLGFQPILVARRRERLEALESEFRTTYDIPVTIIQADLSQESDIQSLVDYARKIENVEYLVNNAGFGTVGWFDSVEEQKHASMLTVHLMATIRLSRAALPAMLANHKGAIINVSSMAAFFPLPGGALYCATKAALVSFSRTLALELRGSGVQVQALCPGFIYTEFHDTPEYRNTNRHAHVPRFLWGPAEPVVDASLKALSRGQVICIPGGLYKMLSFIGRNQVFSPLVNFGVGRIFRRR